MYMIEVGNFTKILNFINTKVLKNIMSSYSLTSAMVEIVTELTCCCKINDAAIPPGTLKYKDSIEIPGEAKEILYEKAFLAGLIKSEKSLINLDVLVTHLCWEEKEISTMFWEMVVISFRNSLLGIKQTTFRLYSCLMQIDDNLQQWRLEKGIPVFLDLLKMHINSQKSTQIERLFEFFEGVIESNETLKKKLISKYKSKLNDVLSAGNYTITV